MITLTGILRQAGLVELKDGKRLKMVVEHETPRDNGQPDLALATFFLEPDQESKLPKPGQAVSVSVRPYPLGKQVGYAAMSLVGQKNAA